MQGRKRILICALNYAPEFVGAGRYTAELAEWLAADNWSVRVVTTPPYYPAWRLQSPYSALRFAREQRSAVDVIRCPIYVPHRPRRILRLLHLLSFGLSSVWPVLRSRSWKPAVILMVAPTIASAWAVLLLGRVLRVPVWLHVQDFEFAAAQGVGLATRSRAGRLLAGLESWLYRRFDHHSTISHAMITRLRHFGIADSHLLPNWVDCQRLHPGAGGETFRQRWGVADDEVVVLYAGTLNAKQNLEVLIEAAGLTGPGSGTVRVHVVICGQGPEEYALRQAAQSMANIRFIPPVVDEELPALLDAADIHALPQRPEVASAVMPSKLTGMLASGKPVVATAAEDTDVALALKGAGICVAPGDSMAFAAAIRTLSENRDRRQQLGQVARQRALLELDQKEILERFSAALLAVASDAAVTRAVSRQEF